MTSDLAGLLPSDQDDQDVEFSLDEPRPRRQTLNWFAPSARVKLPVTNHGTRLAAFRLEATDEDRGCTFAFELPGEPARRAGQAELRVPPGQTVEVTVHITPLSRPLAGLRRETHFCVIAATLLAEPPEQRALLARVQTQPLLGPGALALLAVCLLAAAGLIVQRSVYYARTGSTLAQPGQNEQSRPADSGLSQPAPAAPAGAQSAMTYQAMFEEIAGAHGLDWRLLAELAYQESQFNPAAVGAAREVGLMQILPITWDEWAPRVGASDPFDPYSNVRVAAAYMAFLKQYCAELGHPEDRWVLVAYNWGPETLRRFFEAKGTWDQVPADTRDYVLSVLTVVETGAMSRAALEGIETTIFVSEEMRLNLTGYDRD
jgi:soluble lytic murein transglycosylase-like protein